MPNIIKYKSPFGVMTIQENDGKISRVYLPNSEPCVNITESSSGLLEEAKNQFGEYFNGARKAFELPLSFDGCGDFYIKVYLRLLKIPYGETASYKQIAEAVDCPKGYRAVGSANNKNPLPVIIPCHRVIGGGGKPVGYAGGIDLKIKLLGLEKLNACLMPDNRIFL